MATFAAAAHREEKAPTLGFRLREFLWLSSGMFSAAALALSAVGYLALGPAEQAARNFTAALAAALLFGLATLLKFGPQSA